MSHHRSAIYLIAILACLAGVSCSGSNAASDSGQPGAAAAHVSLNGSGASFPEPIYDTWFIEYKKLHPELSINYQAIGSGGGITQLTKKTVDFGASDAAMTDEEMAKVDVGVQLVPMTAGSIVLGYNLPGGPSELKLSREAYIGIFLGNITKWNDPAIAKANPGATLPDTKVTVVRRSDSSGTTFVFTQHLAAISEEFKKSPGAGKSVNWDKDFIAAPKNDGVATTIHQTPGAIGYIEYAFARESKMAMALLENKSGKYVPADMKHSEAALASVEMPDDLRAWITDPAADDAYPIVTYTWLLCYKKYDDAAKAKELKALIRYCLTEGQKISPQMGYVPLPEKVVTKVVAALDNIKP